MDVWVLFFCGVPIVCVLPSLGVGSKLLSLSYPAQRLGGILTAFPGINLILWFILTQFRITFREPYPQLTELLPSAIILVVMLFAWRIIYRNPPKLPKWLWISLILAILHAMLLPVMMWAIGVTTSENNASLSSYAFPELFPLAVQLNFPILCLFAFLPTLAALFNFWMSRREIG